MLTAITGINWGDEGKGRMVDLITSDYDVVVRYQGGGNAGHTVVNEFGKFALHLLPSGIFRKGVVNILGNGVALDCESLWTEMSDVMDQGVAITPENLKISDRASLLLPWHRDLDSLEEARLADKKYGSTKQGIAPFYSDKYQKKTIMAGELLEDILGHLGVEKTYTANADVLVPNLSGLNLADATSALQKNNLTLRTVGDGGTVTGQIPAAGASIPGGSQVVVYLGESVPTDPVEVPNVTGKTAEAARQALENAGLYMKATGATDYGSSTVALSQSIEAGTPVEVQFIDNSGGGAGWGF